MRQMPTGAKLIAALCYAAIGWQAAVFFEPVLSDVQRSTWFVPLNAALGILIGWRVMGRMVGGTYGAALRGGIYSSIWLFFWSLLGFSLWEMIDRSLAKRYRHPTEALGNALEIGAYYFKLAMQADVLAVLLLGGLIAGLITEFTSRRWS